MVKNLPINVLDRLSEMTKGSFVIPPHELDSEQRKADNLATAQYIQNRRNKLKNQKVSK